MHTNALASPFATACLLLVVAGVAKLRSPSAARVALGGVGVGVSAWVVRGLGAVEVGVGGWAAVRPGSATAGLVALLYGGFVVFTLASLRSGGAAPCGCFGELEAEVSVMHVWLDAAGCSVAVFAVVVPPPGVLAIARANLLVAGPLALGVAAATLAVYLVFTALPAAWRAYGAGER